MKIVGEFQRKYRGVWNSVHFLRSVHAVDSRITVKGLRFCEALGTARGHEILLTRDNVTCEGALYSFGWNRRDAEEIVGQLTENRVMPRWIAKRIIESTPRLDSNFNAVGINLAGTPDLLISFVQPEVMMHIMMDTQRMRGEDVHFDVSSFLSVCGNTAVRCYLSGQLAISYGCIDSREYGSIGRDRLICAIPYSIAEEMIKGEIL